MGGVVKSIGGAIGGLFGGGRVGSIPSSGFGNSIGANIGTPAYRLASDAGGSFLSRLGSVPQLELGRRFPQFMSEIDTLKGMVAPTASLLRQSALGQFDATTSRELGNLREQQSRRSLEGANFAADTRGRVAAEFANQRTGAEAQIALQEIGLSTELINFQNQLIQQDLNRELAELQITAGTNVQQQQISQANAIANAQLAMAQQQSQGALFGSLLGAGAGLWGMSQLADAIRSTRGPTITRSTAPSVGASGVQNFGGSSNFFDTWW